MPTSCRAVVLNGLALLAPRLSPVVIGISCPMTRLACSLSMAMTDGVDSMFESCSFAIALIMVAKLSPFESMLPTPAISP